MYVTYICNQTMHLSTGISRITKVAIDSEMCTTDRLQRANTNVPKMPFLIDGRQFKKVY